MTRRNNIVWTFDDQDIACAAVADNPLGVRPNRQGGIPESERMLRIRTRRLVRR